MEISKIKKALIEQKNMDLPGNLYHKTQLDFAYNTNHIEGSTITPDETASIYDTGTILTSKDKVIVLKDATETKNHFTLFKYMLDTIDDKLSEDMIKKFHFILKDGTLTNNEKGYLIDTCLNSQDNYERMANYFLEDKIMTFMTLNISRGIVKTNVIMSFFYFNSLIKLVKILTFLLCLHYFLN